MTWLGLGALLLLAWFAYHPGLAGGFLFDDFVNLDKLGASGRVDDWAAFWRYLTSGSADPTGRPLAMLSFLLDANDWPADPRPFLRTNVLLHLANTALLFALLRQLGKQLDGASRRNDAAALLGAGLWALHPLFVSTTLYIVQREAMLAATCILPGLLAWGHGRALLARSPRAGTAWMLCGIGFGTLLAMLCKANGALLPLLAWVLDATVYRRDGETPLAKRLRFALLVLPSLLLSAYVLSKLAHWSQPLQSRPWTIGQRVLTEPGVLLDYLRLLLVPRVLSNGVYNDGYAWSRDWLHPASTLPALLAVLALVVAGFALRRRAPALAAALLFFFAGHLLESTTIPLELYFEHRNYLPALLLGWPLARAVARWRVEPPVRWLIAAVLLALLGGTTWMRASLWADQPRMAGLWLALNPGSSRAIATQALFDLHAGKPALAMTVLSEPWRQRPHDLQLALNYISASCELRGPAPAKVDAATEALRNASEGDQLAYRWLGDVLDLVQSGGCKGVDVATVERWTRAALANPRMAAMPGRRQDLHAVLGRIALARGDAATALREFRTALDAWPAPDAAAQESALLASSGHPAEGLALLDHYDAIAPLRKQATGWNMPRLHQWVLERQGYWSNEFAELRRKMREDLASQAAGSTH
ncbi:tetratricopeptide repeat protein [Pseudoluteimonas lycopersici]|uniref:Tetratricopeptide repeat protein n=1 Tax=Pseudoluteimonas lycopersici TaxID=1324796 RepID=A0A516V7M9_9GAMM|nr:tetratricopeptide repeat protein [Lysobacter lycopersici]QDQ74520.1 tetratricopeptide repeat protein [Lysobacter lycopersici]